MFVCLCVELIPSSDKPRNISFFYYILDKMTHWSSKSNETLLGPLTVWDRSDLCGTVDVKQRVTVFSSVTWGVSTWIHLHRVTSRRRNSEEKSVLPFSNVLLLTDQRSQLAGETPERSHSWVWTVTEATTHHRQIIDHAPTQTPPPGPLKLSGTGSFDLFFFIFVFFKYRVRLQGREWEMNGN